MEEPAGAFEETADADGTAGAELDGATATEDDAPTGLLTAAREFSHSGFLRTC